MALCSCLVVVECLCVHVAAVQQIKESVVDNEEIIFKSSRGENLEQVLIEVRGICGLLSQTDLAFLDEFSLN